MSRASDGPVVAAERLLSGHFFKNAMTLRFKRNKYGSWRWLEDIPFCLPMCLADLIGIRRPYAIVGLPGADRRLPIRASAGPEILAVPIETDAGELSPVE